MKINIIIPARFGSTRLQGKPLYKIKGREMIKWVVEGIKPPNSDYRVIVATDDKRIIEALTQYDYCTPLISDIPFKNGTERVYWASRQTEKADIIINLQGDEPLITFDIIEHLAKTTIESSSGFATLCTSIDDPLEIDDPNTVKMVLSADSYALYFSRSPIPYNRDNQAGIVYKKHIGIYGFTHRALELFNSWEETVLEKTEKLEQLRILYNGHAIKAGNIDSRLISVDTEEDAKRVENYLNKP